MQERESIDSFITNQILPYLGEIKKLRTEHLWYVLYLIILSFIICSSIFYFNFDYIINIIEQKPPAIFGVLTVIALVFSILCSIPFYLYRFKVKDIIMPKVLKYAGDFKYYRRGKIDKDKINKFGILPIHQHYSSEDYICGNYKNFKIEIAEATLRSLMELGKNNKIKFRGLFILVNLNQKLKGKTVITENDLIEDFNKTKFSRFKKMTIGSLKFKNYFQTFTTNKKEAEKIITNSLQEKLIAFQELSSWDNIKLAFQGNQLFIMLPIWKNCFEITRLNYSTNTLPEKIKKMLQELDNILSIVDTLELDSIENEQQ